MVAGRAPAARVWRWWYRLCSLNRSMRRFAAPFAMGAMPLAWPGLGGAAQPLEPIEISAPRLERTRMDTPAAVDRVERHEIRQGRAGLTLSESLRRVPGLFFQNQFNFAQGLRISTRGFGARAPFGIRGIQLRVDGFPATLPDGQAQTDLIDLASADHIEVLRGPAAVAYGNAAGGVIDVTTADGRSVTESPVASAEAGGNDLRQFGIRAGGSGGDNAYHVSLSHLDFGGFRDQSRVERARINAKITHSLGPDTELQTVITLLDNPESNDPGGLTAAELAADRDQATANALALDAGQTAEQQRIGLRWRHGDVAGGELTVRGFWSRREFEQQLPFPGNSLLGFERDFFGGGLEFTGSTALAGRSLDYVIGAEVDRQIDERFRFAVDGAGAVQRRTADERQQATETGVFARADLALGPRIDLSAGLRLDRVRFEIDDDLVADGDDSGARVFDEASGSVGALFTVAPRHRVYANLGTAFETPTFTEFADPDGTGGFNPAIDPQEAVNAEIGARGRLAERLRYDIALFRVEVRDEIVGFEKNGRDFFENAARTERDGLELGLDWVAGEHWSVAAAYTYSDFAFERFVDRAGNDFSGNALPGLPEHKLFVEADWQGGGGRYARLALRHVDDVFADNANNIGVDRYTTLDARIGRAWHWGDGRRLDAWLGVDNLTDERYIANVRVNANAGRFFEPAPGRTLLAGVELGF